MPPLNVPAATAGPCELADYLELRAMRAADRNSSIQDLIQDVRRTGTSEELGHPDDDRGDTDRGGEKSESCALDAFGELEDRKTACGARDAYPFDIGERSIQLQQTGEDTVYTFLLLLSRYGMGAGPTGTRPERL